jgi:hypothetical protein
LPAGRYDLMIQIVAENDGQSPYRVLIDGTEVFNVILCCASLCSLATKKKG